MLGMFNNLPKGKLSSDSNVVFMKSFLQLIGSPPLLVFILFLVSFQIFVYFSNTPLLLFAEAKIKYLSPLFSSMYPPTLLKIQ